MYSDTLQLQDWSAHRPQEFKYRGKWIDNWFSNMVPDIITMDGLDYNSVENYYQAQKTIDAHERQRIAEMTPSASKKFGRKVELRPDWEDIKMTVMKTALDYKFEKPRWRKMLLETGEDVLIEWNNWGDRIWGVDISDNRGRNRLGILLMRIRERIRELT